MTRYERLMATLNGKPVDRIPVCFYEINGFTQNPEDGDPFNIFTHPSWKPLIDLAKEKSDRIVLMGVPFTGESPESAMEKDGILKRETWLEGDSRFTRTRINIGGRELTSLTRRDKDIYTTWTIEHLLKNVDDLKLWLQLPDYEWTGIPDVSVMLNAEKIIGDSGIAAIDTGDPLCAVASLFDMAEYTVTAMTEPELFRKALDKVASVLYRRTEAVAKALPGCLWRICGPEYASPPYLPPYLFKEYVTAYVKPMVDIIHKYGGYARVHSHGRLKDILDMILETGCMGLDPIEPPPQGDVELEYVRRKYGRDLVLFGNLEASDLENLPTPRFEEKIMKALREGTAGEGRGFVLMPSACPYGRVLPDLALRNYEKMVECTEKFL